MSNDKKIAALRKSIEVKRSALGPKPRMNYIGNGTVTVNGALININVLNIKAAIVATADVVGKLEATHSAIALLDLKSEDYPEVIQQYKDDLEDLTLRVKGLVWADSDTELRQMDKQLADMLSADAKTSNAIADFESKLK